MPREIARELGVSAKWVVHKIIGRTTQQGYYYPPDGVLFYRVAGTYFIPDAEARAFIRRCRDKRS